MSWERGANSRRATSVRGEASENGQILNQQHRHQGVVAIRQPPKKVRRLIPAVLQLTTGNQKRWSSNNKHERQLTVTGVQLEPKLQRIPTAAFTMHDVR